MRLTSMLWGAISLSAYGCGLLRADEEVDFQRDVLPILSEHCTLCHGVDASSRQGSLRLDQRESALQGGDSGEPAIVPKDPDQSELLRRITSSDLAVRMPPPEHEALTPEQIALLRHWIEQGAAYAEHWAFVPPEKRPLPEGFGEHPVDAFVFSKLRDMGMTPSPRAPDERLCRRLYLDVIGLPPSPDELRAFARDGYEKTLERLLASPLYGERWARVWLDVARYSDTNGYEKDLKREQWIWRDWVIRALNRDKPYDEFIIEQIAGDLLPNAGQEEIIATGFLRNSMINEEGAIVPEQFRMVEMFDRMDCIGKAILGLTTQCAQCHSHKFDPLTQDEYYGLFAFLNDTYESQSWVFTAEQQRSLDAIRDAIEHVRNRVKANAPNWRTDLEAFATSIADPIDNDRILRFEQMEAVSGLNHPVQEEDGSVLMLGHTSNDIFLVAKPSTYSGTGLRMEILTHGDLPFRGPGRSSVGGWDINELEVLYREHPSEEWKKLALCNPTADFSEPENVHGDGKRRTGPVAFLIDGTDDTAWQADRGLGNRNQPSVAVVQFAEPLRPSEPAEASGGNQSQLKIVFRMTDMVGCARFSLVEVESPRASPVDYQAILAANNSEHARTQVQSEALFDAFLASRPEWKSEADEIRSLREQYPQPLTSVLHLAKRDASKSRVTYWLDRGEWNQPQHAVEPHVPASLNPMPAAWPRDRLSFARWLVSDQSPLAARVAVNRVWQSLFGVGLVETSEDFGTRAPLPLHQELLDWLATDFMENGWSQKELIRKIMTSQVYQQDSVLTSEAKERDPQNRYLSRFPRHRVDAEVIRDIALSASGLISIHAGGPSVIPPVPQNILDYNYTYPSYWKPATGPDRYRRSVYIFRKRSMPDPVLSTLDSPNGDAACTRRLRSNTPLAALTTLNEPVFVEAARALAMRVLKESPPTDEDRVRVMFQLCTNREPLPEQLSLLLERIEQWKSRIHATTLDCRAILGETPEQAISVPEPYCEEDAAVWTLLARVLLNLDETIVKS